MAINLLNQSQTASSVSNDKITSIAEARRRIVAGLQGQLDIWNKDKGASLPDKLEKNQKGHSKSNLWFKQKSLNSDWLLKIKSGQTSLYIDAQAKKQGKAWFTVPESEMASTMEGAIKQIGNGDWDALIKEAHPKLS